MIASQDLCLIFLCVHPYGLLELTIYYGLPTSKQWHGREDGADNNQADQVVCRRRRPRDWDEYAKRLRSR